jgi:hypothetical protein
VYRSRNLCAEQILAISTRLEIAEGKGDEGRRGGRGKETAPSTSLGQCVLVGLGDLDVVEPVKRHASEWAAGRQTAATKDRAGREQEQAQARSPCRQRHEAEGRYRRCALAPSLHAARQTPAATATANRIGSSASQPVGQKGARSSSVAGVQEGELHAAHEPDSA